jgi:membrane protein implicated in regulation of membrane protease activity
MRGVWIFLAGVLVFWGLYLLPLELGRVGAIALALLVLVVLTPAVGQSKPRRRAAKPRGERSS